MELDGSSLNSSDFYFSPNCLYGATTDSNPPKGEKSNALLSTGRVTLNPIIVEKVRNIASPIEKTESKPRCM